MFPKAGRLAIGIYVFGLVAALMWLFRDLQFIGMGALYVAGTIGGVRVFRKGNAVIERRGT
jgi:hypothetical protein